MRVGMSKAKEIVKSNQDETIARLYSLRAGLSVISQRADDIRDREEQIDDANLAIKKIDAHKKLKINEIEKLHQNNEECLNKIK